MWGGVGHRRKDQGKKQTILKVINNTKSKAVLDTMKTLYSNIKKK
jgi:hypothetical protein